ncbi:hypothetical protein [Cryobacterium sp. Y50]|uniref:hypothetical protein n=1 Tax=Cryobacterium sp. Y50 TaxID=2048286 RepID=UPI000CE2C55B|nr:hypothetical protein [Cryobacterium sp. Y50]
MSAGSHNREQYREVKVDRIESINFADYDLCLCDEMRVPAKSSTYLMLRNLSFDIVQQRQLLASNGDSDCALAESTVATGVYPMPVSPFCAHRWRLP